MGTAHTAMDIPRTENGPRTSAAPSPGPVRTSPVRTSLGAGREARLAPRDPAQPLAGPSSPGKGLTACRATLVRARVAVVVRDRPRRGAVAQKNPPPSETGAVR